MNKYNTRKFNEVKDVETNKLTFDLFMDSISFKDKIILSAKVFFKTRRGCLFLSCLDKGMSFTAAYEYAFKKDIKDVINMLDAHGWDIRFGKIK